MQNKWQYLVVGVLVGILVSVLIIIAFPGIRNHTLAKSNCELFINTKSDLTSNIAQSSSSTNTPQVKYEGKINLNTGTLDELMQLPGIGESKAKAIIRFRETYGDFVNIQELIYVPGIGENLLFEIKEYVFVEGAQE